MRTLRLAVVSLFFFAFSGESATLVLKRAWIQQFKDRAIIDASFTIDRAHARPNRPANDGDMHVAGRASKEIGLPMVAEIMNAAGPKESGAVQLIHDNEGNGQSLMISGAWRLWFEHPPATGSQIQFASVPPAGNTNPDHCFEIHPVIKIGSQDVTESLRPIQGFTPKDPEKAFGAYEKLSVTLRATASSVTLNSTKAGFNYVRFTMRATSRRTTLKDGGFAFLADVAVEGGDEDESLAHNVRMIFVPGSDPWKKVQSNFQDGDELEVLGIPRINLNAISSLLKVAGNTTVTRKLPYEMIVVALEGDDQPAANPSRAGRGGKR